MAHERDPVQQLRDLRRQTWSMMAALLDPCEPLSPEGVRAWEDLNQQLNGIDARLAGLTSRSRVHADYPGWVDVTAVGDRERAYLPGGPMAPTNLTGTPAGTGYRPGMALPARYADAHNAPGWTAEEAFEFVASTVITGPCADCGMDDEPVDPDRRCVYCATLRALPRRAARHDWRGRTANAADLRCSRCRARHGDLTSRGGAIVAQGPCPGKPAARPRRARHAARRVAIGSIVVSLFTSSIPGMSTASGYLAIAGATLLLLLAAI